MARLVWSEEALRNLDTIGDYWLAAGVSTASELLGALIDAAEPLTRFPQIGHALIGVSPPLRDYISDDFHLIYTLQGETVTIITVLHGRADIRGRIRQLGYETE